MADLEDPNNVDAELIQRFYQEWGNSSAPQKVDEQTIDRDPYWGQYQAISGILTNESKVTLALVELQERMLGRVGKAAAGLTSFFARIKTPKVQHDEILAYFNGRYAGKGVPKKNSNVGKLLTGALEEVEQEYGFHQCGDPVTLTGALDGEVFSNQLIQKGKRWKDVGVPGSHGEHTHRIQWFVAGRVLGKETLKVYKHIGRWFWQRPAVPNYLSLWDALFDRAGGNTNPFAPFNDTDFRSPEKLCQWILLEKNKERFPLLRAYLEARFAKRKSTDLFRIEDYVAVKLYGKDLEGLRKEYKVTKNRSKLDRVAAETGGYVDLGDGPLPDKPESRTKIIERKEFAKYR
jgi:hypothetical protein